MKRNILIAMITVVLVSSTAAAQDAVNGEQVAKLKCASCHFVGPEAPASERPQTAPSFSYIAQRPGVTREFLDNFLSKPHAGMPDFYLSYGESSDVSAYIVSLRKVNPTK